MSSTFTTFTSRWRLVTSAESPESALAAGRSLLAALLRVEPVELAVAPYFRGGFQVEFELSHGGDLGSVRSALEAAFGRACGRWRRADEEGEELLRLWSHDMSIPRAEALEVQLSETLLEGDET